MLKQAYFKQIAKWTLSSLKIAEDLTRTKMMVERESTRNTKGICPSEVRTSEDFAKLPQSEQNCFHTLFTQIKKMLFPK